MSEVILVPEFAPGCFGSALAFSKTDMICRACPFSERCEPVHQKAKMLMKVRFNIGFKEKTKEVKKEVGTTAMTSCKRTDALLKWIEMMNVGVHDKLKEGINPFGVKTPYLALICQMLMKYQRVKISDMLNALMIVEKYSEETAKIYTRISLKALLHLGVVENKDGVFSLRRN